MHCEICGKNVKSIHNHIQWNHKNYTLKSYYDKFLKKKNEGICICGKETRFQGIRFGYAKTCGYSCHNKHKFTLPGYLEKHKKMCSTIMTENNKKNWLSSEYRNKMLNILKVEQEKLSQLKINKCEKKLLDILKFFDSQFEYVGDWSKFVGNKNPDFIHEEKKLIVEMFGDYWHRNDTQEMIQKRLNIFKNNGYDTLIIWENELKDIDNLENKIDNFLARESI
jgi:very-short-patch-repair endonuclease